MSSYDIFVVGDNDTVTLFSLLGAKGMVVDHVAGDGEVLKPVVQYVEQNSKTLGGILLSGDLYDEESRELKKLRSFGIPMIFLPAEGASADAGHKALEELMERAMGMKLKVE